MRLWSIHPKYLDAQGLVAVWREGLLAKNVLEGKTRGYQNHPQLNRFKSLSDPVGAINSFLQEIYREASLRGYNFDNNKIGICCNCQIPVTNMQVEYEFVFLKTKLAKRNPGRFNTMQNVVDIKVNSIFTLVEGEIAEWERVREEVLVLLYLNPN